MALQWRHILLQWRHGLTMETHTLTMETCPYNGDTKETHKDCTVKPVLSDHAWAKKKWSLNRGGLLIEVKMHCKATIGTRPSAGP